VAANAVILLEEAMTLASRELSGIKRAHAAGLRLPLKEHPRGRWPGCASLKSEAVTETRADECGRRGHGPASLQSSFTLSAAHAHWLRNTPCVNPIRFHELLNQDFANASRLAFSSSHRWALAWSAGTVQNL